MKNSTKNPKTNWSKKKILTAGAIIGFTAAFATTSFAYTWQTVGGATGKFFNGVNSLDAVYDLGKVGIGTTTPAFDLHVEGTTNLGGDVYKDGNRVNIGGKWTDGSTTSQAVYMDGNVGLGVLNPLVELHVVSADNTRALINSTGPASHAGISISNNTRSWLIQNQGSSGSPLWFYDETAGALRMSILPNGNVGIGIQVPTYKLDIDGTIRGIEFIYTSDRKLKENITNFTRSSHILNISPKTFDWKLKDGEGVDVGDVGVIAQDVERYFPEFVVTSEDGVKSVNYPKLIVPVIGTIREQQAEINKLKAEIKEIKKLLKK